MLPARILIIDDDRATVEALASSLRLRLFRVEIDTTCSPAAAIASIKTVDYDVILSDIEMPQLNGLDLLSQIHAVKPRLPVLLVSGSIDKDVWLHGMRRGAFALVHKPVDGDQLAQWVKRALEISRLRHQVEERSVMAQYFTALSTIVEDRSGMGMTVLRSLIDTVPGIVLLTDPEGVILLCNRRAVEATGYRSDELVGKAVMDLVPSEWIEKVLPRFADPTSPALRAPHLNPWSTKTAGDVMIEWRCVPFTHPHYDSPCILGLGHPSAH